MHNSYEKNIAIVAHDSGAAQHIFAWIESGLLNIKQCKFCLEGPAAKLFKLMLTKSKLFSLKTVLEGTEMLLTGTSWASSLEHNARILGAKSNINSIAVIDNWLNYKERFVRKNIEVLPNEIWVSDKYAYIKAKSYFPTVKIVRKRNDYIKAQVSKVLNYKIRKQKSAINVLYVLEPIRAAWGRGKIAGEFQALNFFKNSLSSLNLEGKINIILKPHPSDPEDKYDHWINSSGLSNIFVERKKSLARLLAWSDVVVGCETYAMVIAQKLRKRVICSLPKHAHNYRLPYDKIEHIKQINKVNKKNKRS